MATQAHSEVIPEIPPALIPTEPGTRPPDSGSSREAACCVSRDARSNVSTTRAKPKKKLIRRTDRDYSQTVRRSFQGAFLLLNVWIGSIFYFWVRQFEPGGAPTSLARPAGVEGWLPIAGLMNLRYFVLTHRVPRLHPAGMFLLISFLAM